MDGLGLGSICLEDQTEGLFDMSLLDQLLSDQQPRLWENGSLPSGRSTDYPGRPERVCRKLQ